MHDHPPSPLLATLSLRPGTRADYAALARHHYRSPHPGVVDRIFTARYDPFPRDAAPAAVLVLALPTLNCRQRNLATHRRYLLQDRRASADLLNAEVRTISRVIVDPLFRGIGLAVLLVQYALDHAPTPYTEARAHMAKINPFFAHAGMTLLPPSPQHPNDPHYYYHDRRHPTAAVPPSHSSVRLPESPGIA